MTASDVLNGDARWSVERADCLTWLQSLPEDSLDLVLCSPPYVLARTYAEGGDDPGIARKPDDWVAWMADVAKACVRACKGLCAFVVEGQTSQYRYDCTPFLLMAELHRAGLRLRKPCVYFRYGIPGSGGPDWWRNDWEPVVCVAKGRLPWADNTATGHVPKYGPGGEMSNRTRSGARVGDAGTQQANGEERTVGRKVMTRPRLGQHSQESTTYNPPTLANPGNILKESYDAETVRQLLAQFATREVEHSDVIRCLAGGGHLGNNTAHSNEAPFPESLVMPFVLSFCPPGGVVCDPFSGSGTTGAVALRHGRRFLGVDLRQSQVDLASRRLGAETPGLFDSPSVKED